MVNPKDEAKTIITSALSGKTQKQAEITAQEFARAAGFRVNAYGICAYKQGDASIQFHDSNYHSVSISMPSSRDIVSIEYCVPLAGSQSEFYSRGSLVEVINQIAQQQNFKFEIVASQKQDDETRYAKLSVSISQKSRLDVAKVIGTIDDMMGMYFGRAEKNLYDV